MYQKKTTMYYNIHEDTIVSERSIKVKEAKLISVVWQGALIVLEDRVLLVGLQLGELKTNLNNKYGAEQFCSNKITIVAHTSTRDVNGFHNK